MEFFNQDTGDCNKTSFDFWSPHYDKDEVKDDAVHLTIELRVRFNQLLRDVNNLINQAVGFANDELGGNRVHFVSMRERFNNHRWCEVMADGDHEPKQDRADTFFFLSAWPDIDIPDTGEDVSSLPSTQPLFFLENKRRPTLESPRRRTYPVSLAIEVPRFTHYNYRTKPWHEPLTTKRKLTSSVSVRCRSRTALIVAPNCLPTRTRTTSSCAT